MSVHARKRSAKIGLPPGSLIHIGKQSSEKTTITILDYNESRHEEREAADISACGTARDGQTVRWINVDAVHDIGILEQLGPLCGVHPLTLEDILNTDQRPKMEDFGDYIYIVLKMFAPAGERAGELKLSAASCGESSILKEQERSACARLPRSKLRGMRSLPNSLPSKSASSWGKIS